MSIYKETVYGNQILEKETFAISYRKDFAASSLLLDIFAPDRMSDETALVVLCDSSIVGKEFFILNGDFRQQYADLAEVGLSACLKFFLSQGEYISSWGNSKEKAEKLLNSIN